MRRWSSGWPAIGLVPGQDFDPEQARTRSCWAGFRKSPSTASCCTTGSAAATSRTSTVGASPPRPGIYGTNYIQRALITAIGLGANLPEDAVYPVSQKSGGGILARAYDGGEKYVMRFEKGQTPPVNGFWSLTMYDANYFFVANPLNRYSISPRQALKSNRGWVHRSVHPKGFARRRQGVQLAAGTGGEIHPDAAALLAERNQAFDPRRIVGDTTGAKGELSAFAGKHAQKARLFA